MSKLKVYISSTFLDMQDLRKGIIDKIQNGLPEYFELSIIMEQMKGDFWNRPNVNTCLEEVRKADLYIILIGDRYGSFPDSYNDSSNKLIQNIEGYSFTELEYREALKTQKSKFYGIVKFNISDGFWENNADNNCDLDCKDKETKHKNFLSLLSETASPVPIDTGLDLTIALNDQLTKFHLSYNDFVKLNANEEKIILLNRVDQIKTLKAKQIPQDPLGEKLGKRSRSVLLVLGANGTEDAYDRFNIRLRMETIKERNNSIDISNCLQPLSPIMNSSPERIDAILEKVLENCSASIFGGEATNLNFKNLYREIKQKGIGNKVISFSIETNANNEKHNNGCFDILVHFLIKVETILAENDFINNFYFILNIIENDISLEVLDKYYQYICNEMSNRKINIESLNLCKLGLVSQEDIIAWLNEQIANAQINNPLEEIYNFIFVGENIFPMSYRKCAIQIINRTKMSIN